MIKLKYLAGIIGLASFSSFSTQAHEAGDWIVRGGVASVNPSEDSGVIRPTVVSPNGQVSIDSDTQLGLTFTYMLTDNWAVELLASSPFTHTVDFAGDLSGMGSIATAKHLPPTLSGQYFFNTEGNFSPYVGVGINYLMLLETESTANGRAVMDVIGTGGNYSIDTDDSFGLTIQAGFDYQLNDRVMLNAAIWKMDIGTTIKVANTLRVDLEIDPWVYMLGLGYKF